MNNNNILLDFLDGYQTKLSTVIQQIDKKQIADVINVILSVAEKQGTVYLLGNGGSAATASHMENDFNCGLLKVPNKIFNFRCLADNASTLTALSNDFGYDDVFKIQLKGKLKPDDLVLAISGSGNSINILKAVKYAKEMGNCVVALTGFNGGKLYEMADHNLHIPIDDMQITEDIHIVLNHMMVCAIKSYYSDIS